MFSPSVIFLSWLKTTQTIQNPIASRISSDIINKGVPPGFCSRIITFYFIFKWLEIYIKYILKNCKYNYYANDLLIYTHVESKYLHNGINVVNDDIKKTFNWNIVNKLIIKKDLTHDNGYNKIYQKHCIQ